MTQSMSWFALVVCVSLLHTSIVGKRSFESIQSALEADRIASLLLVDVAALNYTLNTDYHYIEADRVHMSNATRWRLEVEHMFEHGYSAYMTYAWPRDELMPLSCTGADTLGGYWLTLLDTLDTLAVLGRLDEFEVQSRNMISELRNFDTDRNVSVFETNIRVLGGLISAHFVAADKLGADASDVADAMLLLAVDLADRLAVAFDTQTGIPYGTVNLRSGVPSGETTETCTAGGGTFALEFGMLSRLTGNWTYDRLARRAVRALWSRKSPLSLVGNHIDVSSGRWTHKESSVGSGIDSYLEYLLKAAVLFGDAEYASMFFDAYAAIEQHVQKGSWFVHIDMRSASISLAEHCSLASFWPGVQALAGDLDDAAAAMKSFFIGWKQFGFAPESYDLLGSRAHAKRCGYPLRPELAESLYVLYRATGDPLWRRCGVDMIYSLQHSTRVACGYAAVRNVSDHSSLVDQMDSFFLAETLKYLYLLFADDSDEHFVAERSFVFNTEAHLLPIAEALQGPPSRFNAPHATSTAWLSARHRCPVKSLLQSLTSNRFDPIGAHRRHLLLLKSREQEQEQDDGGKQID
jgi:ER degradation enhancer, mannosidase alpha-like 2